ncbi:anti-sigma factor antagonist [Conexibacter woesei]|uniref:Anti-sigma factor antagonist n=1 Tax=Conexibacter woesei (strain DSM 14684 / CCUG 47730 / CIP 108061 / JCM 11494 / NBRC 100937 / ID131577) TaxID=469383 RepID=D3EZ41_CONWI|nr:anti-sigma factor antagonist [Conexibacter woesei]ADB51806.1 anti-sigma-factor antagonist [Conexibacter woesei DSM 14684]
MSHRPNLAQRAGRWSAEHRRIAIGGWIALVIVSLFIGSAVGTQHLASEDLGNGESRQADQMLADAGFDDLAPETVLIQSRDGDLTIADPAFRAGVSDVVVTLRRFPTVTNVESPLSPAHAQLVSRDGGSALVSFDIRGDEDAAEDRVGPILDAVAQVDQRHPRLRIEEFGDASANKALTKAFEDDFRKAEFLSLPITLAILVLAFGALVAAGLPLLLGLSAVAITLGLLAPVSQLSGVDEAISSVILLVGLAVGVDYCLFYIRRERDERRLGRGKEAALDLAAATSGRAVLVSGFTVMVAMAGMYITGNATFQSFATGTIMVVAIAVIGSLTVLPAMLSLLGDRIDKGRVPLVGRLHKPGSETGFWATIVGAVLRHPLPSVLLSGGLLVVLALPALGLHTVNSGVQGLPRDLPVMQTYDRIQAAFPGEPTAATIALSAPDATAPQTAAAIAQLRRQALATGLMQDPVTVTVSPDRTVTKIDVPLTGTGTDDASDSALLALRDEIVPATVGRLPSAEAPVTGLTANSYDFNQLMKSRAPWVFVFVLSLAFVLLMVTFRSIVIPAKAIVLNLLSVGAAYGILVWIFQDGHLESLIGFTSIGGITSWLPLFLFVILFGLSMDYHVFILSRVREGYDRGMPTEEAVSHGIRATAGVVTSAAAVMVGVFAIFATLSSIDFKMMGIGLSVAVLLDATIVRAVLLPATMKLLGDWNWYLPRWLEWLPRVAVETERVEHPEGAVLAIDVEREDGRTSLQLSGELDLQTTPQFRDRLADVEPQDGTLVVDLRRLTFIDSSGIGELVGAHQRARRAHRRIVLVRTDGTAIDRTLHLTAVDKLFETVSDPPELAGRS